MDTTMVRIGGVLGVASALVMIPAYVVGTPDRPADTAEAERYYSSYSSFVTANGVVPVLHVRFFLFFLGALAGLLRRADGERTGLANTALAGGIVFVALTAAGWFPLTAAVSGLVWIGVIGLVLAIQGAPTDE